MRFRMGGYAWLEPANKVNELFIAHTLSPQNPLRSLAVTGFWYLWVFLGIAALVFDAMY